MRTLPVNQSGGPSPDGCEPLLLISIYQFDCLLITRHASLITSSWSGLLVLSSRHVVAFPRRWKPWRRRIPEICKTRSFYLHVLNVVVSGSTATAASRLGEGRTCDPASRVPPGLNQSQRAHRRFVHDTRGIQ